MVARGETGQKIEMVKVLVQVPLARMLKEKETCMTVFRVIQNWLCASAMVGPNVVLVYWSCYPVKLCTG